MPDVAQSVHGRPLLLGHRGARIYAPENTYAAFDLALEHGCDGFEFDVRLTADSVPIICHDPKFARAIIAASTCAQLQEIAHERALPVPLLLEDVLARYAASAVLDIELKVAGLEEYVLAALRRHLPQQSYCVSSFLPEVLLRINQLDPDVPLGLICDRPSQLACWPSLPVKTLFIQIKLMTPELRRQVHAAGQKLFVWTVNRAASMRRLATLEVDGILSDDTRLLAQTLART